MNNELLDTLPKMLRDNASELETQIRELENSSPTEANYEEFLYITGGVINIAIRLTKTLKTIAEDAGIEAPDSVMGAARQVYLDYSPKEKDEVVRIALVAAKGILNNYNRLVDASTAEIAETCHNIMQNLMEESN